MDYVLLERQGTHGVRDGHSLNPCFNGLCSSGQSSWMKEAKSTSLNPCFNGLCSSGLR